MDGFDRLGLTTRTTTRGTDLKVQHSNPNTPSELSTDRNILNKGLQYLVYSLPLAFIGPSVIYNAFMNQQNHWHYLVLAVGIVMCFGAMFLMFKGILTVVKSIFDK